MDRGVGGVGKKLSCGPPSFMVGLLLSALYTSKGTGSKTQSPPWVCFAALLPTGVLGHGVLDPVCIYRIYKNCLNSN